jgi:hypothetical protein
MGLDFSHCNAHWSYRGFHNFRVRLASLADIDLDTMPGFTDTPTGDWGTIHDPITILLDHSDCEGNLSPLQCAIAGPRLEELSARLEDEYDRINAIRLADGMRMASKRGESLIFR